MHRVPSTTVQFVESRGRGSRLAARRTEPGKQVWHPLRSEHGWLPGPARLAHARLSEQQSQRRARQPHLRHHRGRRRASHQRDRDDQGRQQRQSGRGDRRHLVFRQPGDLHEGGGLLPSGRWRGLRAVRNLCTHAGGPRRLDGTPVWDQPPLRPLQRAHQSDAGACDPAQRHRHGHHHGHPCPPRDGRHCTHAHPDVPGRHPGGA